MRESRVLKFTVEIFRKFPWLLGKGIFLVLVMAVIEAASIVALAPVVDLLTKQEMGTLTKKIMAIMSSISLPVGLGSVLTVFLVFNFAKSGFAIWVERSILKAQLAVQRDIMLGTLKDFFNTRWEFFSSSRQGALINTFIREDRVVGKAFGAMARYFANIFRIALYFAVPFYISWKVTAIGLGAAILFALPFLMLGKISTRLGRENTTTGNQITSVLQESLSSAKVILGFAQQDKGVKRLALSWDAHWQAALKSWTLIFTVAELYLPFGLLVLVITMFAARGFGLPLSEASVLLYSLLRAVPKIGFFLKMKNSIDNFFPSYEQIVKLRQRAKAFEMPKGGKLFTNFKHQIVIDNLSFSYASQEPTLLNVNIHIPKCKIIAIVGESGSGKSTLIDLIMSFHKPSAGEILVDNLNLQDFDINSYRRRIGYVPQDSILFNMTVADNLRWVNEEAHDADIKYACQLANADKFISELPQGYDTFVGDRGIRLSGGQIQRLAIARALMRRPDILILDEATSSLDTNSERLIQQALENIAKETTIVMVAHRLSTIVNADYIYVLKKGQVKEEGTYAQLMQKNGDFCRMIDLQTLEALS